MNKRNDEEPLPTDPTRPAGTLSALIESVRAVGDRLFSLVALEGKQAGVSLAFMLGFGVAAAVLVITGWLALIACVVVALVENDIMGWPWALVIAAFLSFAGAAGLVVLLMQRSKDLLFTATRRQLRSDQTRET
ncbi:MAG: phage holin family protein [Betaproteobacteria bacterium]|nr:phage holin family protein [Betaproteobacteria bacterium]